MIQVTRLDQYGYDFKLTATEEEWLHIRAILDHAVNIYEDTELPTILDLSKQDFSLHVDVMSYPDTSNILLDREDVQVLFIAVGELCNRQIPGLSKEQNCHIQSELDKQDRRALFYDDDDDDYDKKILMGL